MLPEFCLGVGGAGERGVRGRVWGGSGAPSGRADSPAKHSRHQVHSPGRYPGDVSGPREAYLDIVSPRVPDGVGAISGNRNVNSKRLAGPSEEQRGEAPAGLCFPLGSACVKPDGSTP